MDLNTICFLQFAFLFAGFVLLEGFDYGVGMLLPFWGKSEAERKVLVDTLAPVWEGNEVWLVAAGAFLFAGFPHAYATIFSGAYLALLFILGSLILRGVAFEFRDRQDNKAWRQFWDWSIFTGSFLPAVLWGVAIANLLAGMPINADKDYAGSFGDLLTPFTLISGVIFPLLFIVHGIAYLTLRLDYSLVERMLPAGHFFCKIAVMGLAVLAVASYAATDISEKAFASAVMILPVIFVSLIRMNFTAKRYFLSFAMSCGAVLSAVAAIFSGLYPRLVVSRLNPQWSLDIYNSAANPLTLDIMSSALLLSMPVILAFEAWKFAVFKQRVALPKPGKNVGRTRKLLQELRALIENAKCCADVLQSAACALRSGDGNVLSRVKYKHKLMLFAGIPRKLLCRRAKKRSRNR
jgi:cytochrome d ubiquinol oxidase subunit II